MRLFRKKIMIGAALLLFSLLSMASNSMAILSLPDPTQTYDGIYVAWAHDDFWSYSAKFLDLLQDGGYISTDYGEYQFPTGSGGLDVILYTGAGGIDNQGVGPGNAYYFEDPTYDSGGARTYFDGWWGQSDQNNDGTTEAVHGPVTVGQVLEYLQAMDPYSTIPAFYLDLNQTGKNLDMWFSGQVMLIDPDTGDVVHVWAFDTNPQGSGTIGDNDWPGFGQDGDYDPDYPGIAIGLYPQTGTSGTLYNPNHSKGSGKPDYITFAPSMDLSQYDSDLLFVTEFHMGTSVDMNGDGKVDGKDWGALNNGYEEIFLTALKGVPQVPEPTSLLLLGLGLLGLAGVSRRMHK